MTDKLNNGWEGWILGIKQAGVLVSTFTLNSGGSGSQTIILNNQLSAVVYVVSGKKTISTKQIGFTISLISNGIILFDFPQGPGFTTSTIFKTFCVSICTGSPSGLTEKKSKSGPYKLILTRFMGRWLERKCDISSPRE